MKVSSDVNTIFAKENQEDLFHKPVVKYMAKKVRHKYVLLNKVKTSFLFTFQKHLINSAKVIDYSIRQYKAKREDGESKPNPFEITSQIEEFIDEKIQEDEANTPFYNKSAVRNFINYLLTDFSLIELYEDDDSFGEFREEYMEASEQRALDAVNNFVQFFSDFEVEYIEEYSTYEEWKIKIKNSENSVFENKKDEEDIKIAAEFLAYNQERVKIEFFTCDKNCHDSIHTVAGEYDQRFGKVVHIQPSG